MSKVSEILRLEDLKRSIKNDVSQVREKHVNASLRSSALPFSFNI